MEIILTHTCSGLGKGSFICSVLYNNIQLFSCLELSLRGWQPYSFVQQLYIVNLQTWTFTSLESKSSEDVAIIGRMDCQRDLRCTCVTSV